MENKRWGFHGALLLLRKLTLASYLTLYSNPSEVHNYVYSTFQIDLHSKLISTQWVSSSNSVYKLILLRHKNCASPLAYIDCIPNLRNLVDLVGSTLGNALCRVTVLLWAYFGGLSA